MFSFSKCLDALHNKFSVMNATSSEKILCNCLLASFYFSMLVFGVRNSLRIVNVFVYC